MIIDLRSDTVTKPTKGMLDAMMSAKVGDDVFAEDPTVQALEEKVALLFSQEAGIFCPSGTMTNQIAIKAQTSPLDEIICDKYSHIFNYEVGGHAFHSGLSMNLLEGSAGQGRMQAHQIESAIKPDHDWLPNSRMVVLENTVNKGGGSVYALEDISEISKLCKEKNLICHLDGARVFNAITDANYSSEELGVHFNSISVCLSKGLGSPIGSVLVGDKSMIKKARKIRKVMGGGMRQAGIIAAAGLYALDHHIDRISDDHRRAHTISEALGEKSYIKNVFPVSTNILIFEVDESKLSGDEFIQKLKSERIHAIAFAPQLIRFVTHLDFTDDMLEKLLKVLSSI